MHRRSRIIGTLGLAALFAPGLVTAARADVVNLYNFNVSLNGSTVFNDNFSQNQTLSGPSSGAVLPAGPTYSDGTTALYAVIGTVTETGAPPTLLNTALGAQVTQSGQFNPLVKLNVVTLLTGPPGAGLSNFPLTPTSAFSTSALFAVTPPATPIGFYQVNLSNRVPSNMFQGDVLSMQVQNCVPAACPGLAPGYYIQLIDANAVTGIVTTHDSVPLDTSEQQVLLELVNDPSMGVVDGYYQYFDNGSPVGSPTLLGSYGGLFGMGPGQLEYTEAGFVQLAPVPEPSSLLLLAGAIPGVLGLVRRRRRKAAAESTSAASATSVGMTGDRAYTPSWSTGVSMQAFILLAASVLLASHPANGEVHNQFCFQGTCTIQNPAITNVYWDSSLADWDKDVAANGMPELAHRHIDDLTLALVHSDYFNALGQYSVNTPTLGPSISANPCMQAPNDIASAIKSLQALTSCLFQYYPQLNNGNTILNIYLPPSVASNGWCTSKLAAQHDEYSTPVAITILPTACISSFKSGWLNALFYNMSHEVVEAATDPNPNSPTGWKTQIPGGIEIGDACQPPNAFNLRANFLYGQVTAYWSNNDNGCVYGWSSPPISASASACGTGSNMTLTLVGSFGGAPWDLASQKFGGNTLYLNAQIQHAGGTWSAGNFEGLPNNNGTPDQVYFVGLNWSPGTIKIQGFDNGYGQSVNGTVAQVSPGDTINIFVADPSNGLLTPIAVTAPFASQIANFTFNLSQGDPYVVVNGQATVAGLIVDANNCAVQGETVLLNASAGTFSPSSVTDLGDGTFQSSYTAPDVAGFYEVTATASQPNTPSVTADVNVPVHPVVNAVNPSIGPAKGGQAVTVTGDGFVNPSGTAVFFNSTTAQVQSEDLKSIQAVTPASPLGGFGDGVVGVSANSLLTLNSNSVQYTYIVPGRPYFNFYDIGCQGQQLYMMVIVYDGNGEPTSTNIHLTAHRSLMFLNQAWAPEGDATSGTLILVTVQQGTYFTATTGLWRTVLFNQPNPFVNTASPYPSQGFSCVKVHLLLPKELGQFQSAGGDLSPRQMEASTPNGNPRSSGQRLVVWTNTLNPGAATSYVTGHVAMSNRIQVRTLGFEKFRSLMQPSMYLRADNLPSGTAPGADTIPVVQARFLGPALSITLRGQPEEEVAPLGDELQLSLGAQGGGAARDFRVVHLLAPQGERIWVEDEAANSYAGGRALTRTVKEAGIYALVQIVGARVEPVPLPLPTPPSK